MNDFSDFISELSRVVERHGGRVAVEDVDSELSYAALWERASCVHAWLSARGIGPGDVVAVELDKSPALIAVLVGVWRAGAAYLPLDPRWPEARRRQVRDDASARAVIGGRELPGIFDAGAAPAPASLRPADLAYVIYTSGSSGQPKGVCVPHRGIVNLLRAQIAAFELGPGKRSLFMLSPAFDAAISDIGTCLLSGATLVIHRAEQLCSERGLLDAIEQRSVSHVDLPPALLARIDARRLPPNLECVVIGGEAAPIDSVRRWAARVRLVNVYGPTEATVCSSLCRCGGDWSEALIGEPLPGVVYRVLDAERRPVAMGESGELYIGGVGLALGYSNLPELTRERFPEIDGQRWYQSGDLVRVGPRGLAFLGRNDRQLKLRGVRVEPAEIERALLELDTVREAAVVAVPSPAGLRLTACVAPLQERRPLELGLERRLPASMLPAHFEFYAELPRTTNGKLDLEALRRPASRAGVPPDAAPSDTPHELGELFRELTGREPQPHQPLAELGLDSFAALSLSLAAESRGIPLDAAELYQPLTFAELTRRVHERSAGHSAGELQREARGEELMLELELARGRPAAHGQGAILLVGAAGFFGSRLLWELCRRTTRPLLCLVRAADEAAARERVREALRRQGLDARALVFDVLVGDASRPELGLSSAAYGALAEHTSAVVNSAALVNFVLPYPSLAPANVECVRELLRFAAWGKRKTFFQISTLSVFTASDRAAGRHLESAELAAQARVHGGYAQTKLAAEQLLASVDARLVPRSVFRLGLLTGDASRGVGGRNDQLGMVVRGLRALGAVPRRRDELWFDVTPVDHAARCVAALCLNAPPDAAQPSSVFHVTGQGAASAEQLVHVLRDHGVTLEELDNDRWAELARGRASEREIAVTYASFCRCLSPELYASRRGADLFQATSASFDDSQTRAALAGGQQPVYADTRDVLAACVAHALQPAAGAR